MKKTCLIGGLVLLAGLLLVGARTRQAFVIESVADVQALWREDEMLVVVQKRVVLLETSWLLHKVTQACGMVYPQPRMLPEDLVVIRLRNGEVQRTDYPGAGRVGNILPHAGGLYFLRGGEARDYPHVSRLEASGLARVPKAEAEAFVASFKLESELVAREGWQKRDLYFSDGLVVYPVQQGANRRELLLFQDRNAGMLRIELLEGRTAAKKTLYELSIRRRVACEDELRQRGIAK